MKLKEHKEPWKQTLSGIQNRTRCESTTKYSRYGGRGIKCLITAEELKILWFRDKAYEMRKPSIDRIDNDGHYEFSNCRYLELSENARRLTVQDNKCKRGHEFTPENSYYRPQAKDRTTLERECRACKRLSAVDSNKKSNSKISRLKLWPAYKKAAKERASQAGERDSHGNNH